MSQFNVLPFHPSSPHPATYNLVNLPSFNFNLHPHISPSFTIISSVIWQSSFISFLISSQHYDSTIIPSSYPFKFFNLLIRIHHHPTFTPPTYTHHSSRALSIPTKAVNSYVIFTINKCYPELPSQIS